MVEKTKKTLMIYLTIAVLSIVLFIIIGTCGSIYYINTKTDRDDLQSISNDFLNRDYENEKFKKQIFGKNQPPDMVRRPFFYILEKDGVVINTKNNMPYLDGEKHSDEFKDFDPTKNSDIINNSNDRSMSVTEQTIMENIFKLAKENGSEGTIKYDGIYMRYITIDNENGTNYFFLDTSMTHKFLKNSILGGLVILLLTMVYIIIIGRIILNKALEPLELSIENQKRFTGDASHELRTPLTAMRSNVDVLIDYEMPRDEEKKWLQNISNEIDRMTRLTNELLTLSRNDTVEKIYTQFYFGDVLDSLYHNFQNLCNIEINGGDFDVVAVKEDMLQLLMIFVDNGIKYNDKDEKNISVDATNNDKTLILTVKDNGNGIDADKYDAIFERFYREDKARTGTQNGFGLGLSIAKNIINDYNGKVKTKSEINVGTTFIITLNMKNKN